MSSLTDREWRAGSRVVDEEQIPILRQPYAACLLLFIYENKEVIASQMKRVCKNYNTIISLAKHMKEKGLVEIVARRSPRVTHIYYLTPKGMEVAQKLREIEECICSGKSP